MAESRGEFCLNGKTSQPVGFESYLHVSMAESRGFEPLKPCSLHAFQACALDHYANSPGLKKELMQALLRCFGDPTENRTPVYWMKTSCPDR